MTFDCKLYWFWQKLKGSLNASEMRKSSYGRIDVFTAAVHGEIMNDQKTFIQELKVKLAIYVTYTITRHSEGTLDYWKLWAYWSEKIQF